jgi:lipopolysaccharide transport system ATP-binding protein
MGKAKARRLAKLRREKIAAAQRRATEGPLPDFVVLGTQKGGTSFFYRLLTEHPLVRGAAAKELHFFDNKFAEGVGWYRRCFSEGERVDGQRTITGEASPSYLFDPQVPERIARIVPEARLIALLRNPVDRAYSHYQMEVRRGKEARSFEEATEEEMTSAEGEGNTVDVRYAYLRRGLYAEQLERFSFFANREGFFAPHNERLYNLLSTDFGW